MDRDINAAPPGGGSGGKAFWPVLRTAALACQWDGIANGNYHGLQVAVNRQFSRGLFLKSAYTWSKAINWTDEDGWASVGWNWGPVMDRNRAVAGYNRAQMFTFGFLYEMPFGPGNAWATSGPASWLLRGWQTNGTYAAYTGTPFTMGAAGTSLNAPGNSQTTDGDTRKGESSCADRSQQVVVRPLAFRQPISAVRHHGRNTAWPDEPG